MDPSFFEPIRIRASRISSAVHLVHCTKNHSEIILFHVIEKLLVLRIEFSCGDFFGREHIRRDGDMIDLIFS